MSFASLGLGSEILKAIQDTGYKIPTPIQSESIPFILDGHDLTGIAQTGTGKTAAFTLPMLERLYSNRNRASRKTRVLVLSPTRELVVQIEENVRVYAKYIPLEVATVYGGVGEKPQKKALRDGVELIIATPGRLMDLMGQGCANFSECEFFVLDEADRMLDMGFLPNVRKIVSSLPKNRQTLLFSATLSREIEKLTREFQRAPKFVEIGKRTNPADTVEQFLYEVPKAQKIGLLKHLLENNDLYSVLVFTRTKHGADRVAKQLGKSGVATGAIHSNRTQNQRARALNDFKQGKIRVLVATDIAARGIDVEGITHVVNLDFPPTPEDYIHRIGRTGRAKTEGTAISFITNEDNNALRNVERFMKKSIIRRRAKGFVFNQQSFSQSREGNQSPRKSSKRGRPVSNKDFSKPSPRKRRNFRRN